MSFPPRPSPASSLTPTSADREHPDPLQGRSQGEAPGPRQKQPRLPETPRRSPRVRMVRRGQSPQPSPRSHLAVERLRRPPLARSPRRPPPHRLPHRHQRRRLLERRHHLGRTPTPQIRGRLCRHLGRRVLPARRRGHLRRQHAPPLAPRRGPALCLAQGQAIHHAPSTPQRLRRRHRPIHPRRRRLRLCHHRPASVFDHGTATHSRRAIYDRAACIRILIDRDGMDQDEAEEFFSFNVEGSLVSGGPIYIERLTP